jgi:glyoxylase-like metal-dependent hydrolase (beta-lactamase superfamily II)
MKYFKILFFALMTLNISLVISQNKEEVTIKVDKLSNSVYMLTGQGGNIGISIGEDGVFMIDDQFARLSEKILIAIRKLSDKPIKLLVNTHWHGDHTGGNVNFQKEGATIIAHDNVRTRLKETPKRDNTMRLKEAFPIITFNDKMNIYVNGEQVALFHVDNAHTDGDVLLYFVDSNVLHTGDTYFKGRYPYMDLNSGGSVKGYINAIKAGLMVIDNDTKIIPGHGVLSNKAEYEIFLKMLEEIKANVEAEIDNGKTEEEVSKMMSITKTYDDLGYGDGFINSENFRKTLYKDLKK